MCKLGTLLWHSLKKKSNPQNEPAIDKKNRKLKKACHKKHGCCFISAGKDKSDAEDGLQEGHPAGDPLRNTPFPEVSQMREAAERVRDDREVSGVFTYHAS